MAACQSRCGTQSEDGNRPGGSGAFRIGAAWPPSRGGRRTHGALFVAIATSAGLETCAGGMSSSLSEATSRRPASARKGVERWTADIEQRLSETDMSLDDLGDAELQRQVKELLKQQQRPPRQHLLPW